MLDLNYSVHETRLTLHAQYHYECPQDYVLVNQNCYYFSTSADTWRSAYFNCKDKNGELALVKKKWMDKSLRTYLKTGRMGKSTTDA
ncbi:hypothetical protein RUM43_006859 [Polyplax serrata]|uniref:C-type lectin domain-containing protein n=1 Tax=Polyplax serrata TaxID=468196 RepID=A0AAN8PL67_POLSC